MSRDLASFYGLQAVRRDLVSAVTLDEPPTSDHLPSLVAAKRASRPPLGLGLM
jgi:hypothetical protein